MELRSRAWTILVYPDSAPENWRDIIDDFFCPWAESPLHDKDVMDDNTPKKPHYHIVLAFSGKKSFKQIQEISDSINSPRPFIVHDLRSIIRYFIHFDHPEKYQYKQSDIIAHNGFSDIRTFFQLSKEQKLDIIADICKFIEDYNITEYNSLESYAREVKRNEWYELVIDYRTLFDTKIRSLRNALKGT